MTPFEEDTGCQVNSTDMTDSGNGVDLMQTGEYDGISASGDATLRLIAAETVAPVNVDLIPNYEQIFEGLKLQPHNPVDDVRTASRTAAARTSCSTTPTSSWRLPPGGHQSGKTPAKYRPGEHLQLRDLHRGCGPHIMSSEDDMGITNPYQLNQEQFDAAVACLWLRASTHLLG